MVSSPDLQPLDEVVILDTTQILSGPFATMLLGDLGAEVIKVERLGVGDRARHLNHGSQYFDAVNRNKRSISVDLSRSAGQRLLDTLLAEADVFVENMSKSGAEKLRLTYDRTRGVSEDIIHCSVKGFRTGSIHEAYPSLDIVPQAMSGLMSITGTTDGPPEWPKLQIGDLSTALYAVQAILAALYARELGVIDGEFVEIPMLDATVSLMAARASYTFATDEPFPRGSYPPAAPAGVFECSDGYIAMLVAWDDAWDRLVTALGTPPALDVEAFGTSEQRVANAERLDAVLNDLLATEPVAHWLEVLQDHSVPVAPVYDTKDMWDDDYIGDLRVRMEREGGPDAEVVDNPFHFETLSADVRTPPEGRGESTDAVLDDFGLSSDRIDDLRDDGVIE